MPFYLDDEKSVIVSSKFIVYDLDEDGTLDHFEKFKFRAELGELFGCNKFFNHLNEVMDGNTDGQISLEEWNTFFDIVTSCTLIVGT